MKTVIPRTVGTRPVVLACAIALVLPVAVAYASSVNYLSSGSMIYGSQASTGMAGLAPAPRGWNKVYRNVNGCNPGVDFSLFYTDMGGVHNWCSNPFLDSRSDSNNVAAFCHDWAGPSSPVTCVTTKP